jgi:hypothetical protein
MNDREDENI